MSSAQKQENRHGEEEGWNIRMVGIMAVAYLIIPAMSYGVACLNAPSEIIKEFINATETERTGKPMPDTQVDSLFGLLVAVVGIGAAVGSTTSDAIADRIGRKYAILASATAGLIGTITMALSRVAKAYEMLFVGRTLSGLAIGLGLSLAPPYIMEMCRPYQKGAAAMANIVSQSSSMLLAQILGYQELLGNEDYWQYLIGFPVILLVLQLLLLPLCPQNPRYLLTQKNDEAGATRALQIIRGKKDVQDDIKQLRAEIVEAATVAQLHKGDSCVSPRGFRTVSVVQLFVTPRLRQPLIMSIAMGIHQNWCGMNGILFFSNSLFEDAGITGAASRYATSGTGAVFVIGNLLALLLLPCLGRKTLFVAGTAAIGLFSAAFAVIMVFKDEVDALKYAAIVVALLIMLSYALGPVSVFWVILGELYPHSARGAGFAVAILCAFIGFFSHCYALPAMLDALGSYTFFVFAGIDAVMVLFCIIYMPETKGKTFAEIAQSWSKDIEAPTINGETRNGAINDEHGTISDHAKKAPINSDEGEWLSDGTRF